MKRFKEYVKKYNLNNYVHFLGYVMKDKNNLYNLCNVYVMPSLPSGPKGNMKDLG